MTRPARFHYTGTMSRSLRQFLLPALLTLSVAGCATPYRRLYGPARRTYKPPVQIVAKDDADKLLGPADANANASAMQFGGLPVGGAPVAPMPMGEVPAADPLNMQPADPAAPPPAPAPPL